ncbi:MAG: ParB domain protein nuclease, partial [Devosia sp.]|uniref:ParB/Srx family N-terminal domain-containing protein n=1 Tax=Devosia sp. TaxID=1871048 RepID=UPI0026309428
MADTPHNLQVKYLPLAALLPYARNSRTHSDDQVAQIAASIREFGFTNPVLITPTNDIIAGHGRVKGAALAGLDMVPCICLGHLTETQRRAYVIADNRLALNAGWDMQMLTLELQELGAAEFNLELLGFDEKELAKLTGDESPPPAEAVAPPQEWLIVISCGNENEQARLYDQLTREGVQCKI